MESSTTTSVQVSNKYNVRPVEHDLDYLSKHGADDFYSDVRPFEVKHHFDFCKLNDLERHIRRYSSSKLRNEKNALKQEC